MFESGCSVCSVKTVHRSIKLKLFAQSLELDFDCIQGYFGWVISPTVHSLLFAFVVFIYSHVGRDMNL